LDTISGYEISEWVAFYTLEAEDEREAMARAKRGGPPQDAEVD
jgi:hypothetical protein